jgi:hypothetical protein
MIVIPRRLEDAYEIRVEISNAEFSSRIYAPGEAPPARFRDGVATYRVVAVEPPPFLDTDSCTLVLRREL